MPDTEAPSSLEEALLAATEEEETTPAEEATDEAPADETADDSEAPGDEEEEDDEADDDESSDDLFSIAEKEGFDLRGKYRNPQEAARGLIHAARLVGQRNELAEFGRLLQERPHEVYEALRGRFGEPAKPAKEPEPSKPAGPSVSDSDVSRYLELKGAEPPWDPDWENQVTYDKDGRQVPTDDAEPGVLRKIAAHRRWDAKMAEYAVRKPEVVMKATGLISPHQEEIAQLKKELESIKSAESQRENQNLLMQVAVREREWMFKDGVVQQGNLTEAGQQFGYFLDQLAANSPQTKNPLLLVEAAKAMTIAHRKAQAAQAQNVAKPKKSKTKTTEPPAEEDLKPRNMRERIQGAEGGKGRKGRHFSASAVGRGAPGSRSWPKVNGREMTLAERLLQQIGEK